MSRTLGQQILGHQNPGPLSTGVGPWGVQEHAFLSFFTDGDIALSCGIRDCSLVMSIVKGVANKLPPF